MDTIGERIKYWRKSNKYTMLEVAEKAGISQGLLSECENNKMLIGSKSLLSLYRTYNIDINWILTGEKSKSQVELNQNEREMLENFKKLSEREQLKIIGRIEEMVEIKQEKALMIAENSCYGSD